MCIINPFQRWQKQGSKCTLLKELVSGRVRTKPFLSDSESSPPGHIVFHMPGSELDTSMGAGVQRASVRCDPALLGLERVWSLVVLHRAIGVSFRLRVWGLVLAIACLSAMFLL